MTRGSVWFAARILLESCQSDEAPGDRLFEDRIILVRAETEEEARQKAERFARSVREEYKNPYGKEVSWVFKEVLDIKELFDDVLQDGSEVYYSFIMGEEELADLRRLMQPPTRSGSERS